MHAMKAYKGRECIAPLIVNLDFTFQLLYPRCLSNSSVWVPDLD